MDYYLEKETLLEIKNLNINYLSNDLCVKAVNNLSLELKKGETLGIVGETGAGKTTTALSVLRLLPNRTARITGGQINFDGQNLFELPETEMMSIRGRRISMIFQDPMTSLNPIMTVGEQILEAITLHNDKKLSKKECREKVIEILGLVGISPERMNDYPHQFSGGMKQRVVIAIALSCNPELLIADEPTTALDVTIQAQVLSMMEELKEKLNTSMIFITHDLAIVSQICDRVAVMYAGEIIEFGTVKDIVSHGFNHPYTEGLFGSIPDIKKITKRLKPINGLMPDPACLPEGCKFHPRCNKSMDICKIQPPSAYCKGTHAIVCHRFKELNDEYAAN